MSEGSRGSVSRGFLGEIFTFEATTAEGACDRCGTVAHVGEAMAYVTEIGTVVRCASCDNALIRVTQNPRGYFLDLRGVSYLRFQERTPKNEAQNTGASV